MSLRVEAVIHRKDEAFAYLDSLGTKGRSAATRAVRKATQYAGRQLAGAVAKASRVPLKALTQGGSTGRGKRLYVTLPRPGHLGGSVWLGHNPIKAAYVGALQQLPRGARAGRHRFPGAFVATLDSGHRGVFTLIGGKRYTARNVWGTTELPIAEEKVGLVIDPGLADQVQRDTRARLSNVLRQELNYELNVRGS